MKTSRYFLLFLTASLISSCFKPYTPTPQPTPTSITQPASFLDFDHPRLHEIAGDEPLIIREIARTQRYFEGVPYIAIIVDTDDPVFKAKMLIFRLETPNAVLIYESDSYVYISFNIIAVDPLWLINNTNYYYYSGYSGGIDQFGSSYLEVPVNVSNGGNCYDCTGMKIIGIYENGTASDITPATNFTPKAFIDLDGGNLDLPFHMIATQYYEIDYGAVSHVGSPYAFRLFAWDGSAYVDVSKKETTFYDMKIEDFKNWLQETYGQPLDAGVVMPRIADIFFAYETSGRLEYGWDQIQSLGDLSHWDVKNTPPEEIKSYHDVFDMLEQRKNADKATATP